MNREASTGASLVALAVFAAMIAVWAEILSKTH